MEAGARSDAGKKSWSALSKKKIERAQTLEVRRPTDNAINEPGYVHDELNKFLEICTELSWIRLFAWFEFAIESKHN